MNMFKSLVETFSKDVLGKRSKNLEDTLDTSLEELEEEATQLGAVLRERPECASKAKKVMGRRSTDSK